MDLRVLPRLETENNRQYARRVLQENIMSLHLKPGTVINENEVASLLSVSRTPIREAIFRLKDHHLVEVYPQKASVVTRINLGLLNEGYFLRTEIEPIVYAIACNGMDPCFVEELQQNLQAQKEVVEGTRDFPEYFALDNSFHEIIYRAAKKRRVWSAIQSVSSHFHRIRYFDAICSKENVDLFYQDHKKIYYSILSGATESIREMYPSHLAFYQKTFPRLLEEYPDYFEV